MEAFNYTVKIWKCFWIFGYSGGTIYLGHQREGIHQINKIRCLAVNLIILCINTVVAQVITFFLSLLIWLTISQYSTDVI